MTETANPPRRGWEATGICLLLAALVFIVFGQTIHYGFVNFDDDTYVYKDPMVSKGLSLAGIGWAFTHIVSGHWHPLTLISLMMDSQVFGMRAGGYHFVNVLLHAGCAVLLFLTLREMTGFVWRSGFVAAVFAVHPLRVESVAWVAERKDVLSGVFFMLTLWAYARYAKSKGGYAMILIWFALGLMSKPMLVTTPCVLLLLDYWPLGRLRKFSQFPGLVWGKAPLFALSALSSLAAVLALRMAAGNAPVSTYPANAPVGYVTYLWKLIYPSKLAVLYPLPRGGPPEWEVFDSLLLLTGLTVGAWLLRRKEPYLLTGWFWYLGMLVPVIGVMQTGDQAYADRYTYLPQIGLCIGATWMAADLATRQRYLLAGAGMAIVCALMAVAYRQTTYWRDSTTLWSHALACTQDNFAAHTNLGNAMADQGQVEEAIAEYREAIRINPIDAESYTDLGNALLKEGRTDDAIAEYREALQIKPGEAKARNDLGNALLKAGRTDEAADEYRTALKIDPADGSAQYNLGNAVLEQGRPEDAIAQFRAALRIDPNDAKAHYNLGNALAQQGRMEEAASEYQAAARINPAFAEAHNNMGNVLLQLGRMSEAVGEFEKVLELQPDNVAAKNNLAWTLATAASVRDSARAVQLASQANEATGGNNPAILRTLAAAYAGTGDFSHAIETAQNALQLAQGQSNASVADALRGEMKLYEAGHRIEDAH